MDFKISLERFMSCVCRPYEKTRKVTVVDKVRDWKGWLAKSGKHLFGIGGPTAPRVFEMQRRGGA
jgi:hypothetical protein